MLGQQKFEGYCNIIWASPMAQWIRNSLANTGDTGDVGLILGSRRSPRGRNGNPLEYSFFFFNFILFLNFTILYWFCQILKWIRHRYTCVPHPEPSSLLWVVPVHQPQASSIMHWTWTGDSFHTWYYTCFNVILLNLPTLSLSHRVHKTVLYISVSFAVSYTGLLLPSF